MRGSVQFVSGRARWHSASASRALGRTAPRLARRGVESLSDLQASLGVNVPRTATNVSFDYRLSVARERDDNADVPALHDGRLNLELRQLLPYQPLGSGEWNVLFTLRTLVHDRDGGSLYDELLTARPPARMTGGLQVRF